MARGALPWIRNLLALGRGMGYNHLNMLRGFAGEQMRCWQMIRKRDNIAALRRRLQAECLHLQMQVGRLPIDSVEQIGHGNHMADDASDAFEQAKSLTLRRHLESLLGEVREALGRLDDGTYGSCRVCGQAIDSARLEAIPYASLCLHCKARAERRQ